MKKSHPNEDLEMYKTEAKAKRRQGLSRKRKRSDSEEEGEEGNSEIEGENELSSEEEEDLQISELGKTLNLFCEGDDERSQANLNWKWPSFTGKELGGTVKKVFTPDMILHLYSTIKDQTVRSVAEDKQVDYKKLMELTLYFNSAIKSLNPNTSFFAKTVLVIDMEVRKPNDGEGMVNKQKKRKC